MVDVHLFLLVDGDVVNLSCFRMNWLGRPDVAIEHVIAVQCRYLDDIAVHLCPHNKRLIGTC